MFRILENGGQFVSAHGYYFFWNKYYYFQVGKIRFPGAQNWSSRKYNEINRTQVLTPVKLGIYDGRTYWLFKDHVIYEKNER